MRSPTLFPCILFDSLPSFLSLYCFEIFGHNLCKNYLFIFLLLRKFVFSPSAGAFILTKERKFNLIFTLHIKMQIKFSLISSFSWKSCQRNWASWWKSLLLGLCLQSFDKQIMRLPRSLNLFFHAATHFPLWQHFHLTYLAFRIVAYCFHFDYRPKHLKLSGNLRWSNEERCDWTLEFGE